MKILLVGCGKVGSAIAVLAKSLGYQAYLIDVYDTNLKRVSEITGFEGYVIQPSTLPHSIPEAFTHVDVLINSVPFSATLEVADLAFKLGVNYVDLTEDVETARILREKSVGFNSAFILPQTGLAPGLVSVLAKKVYSDFDELDSLSLRVGALPLFPANRLKYNLTWSTEGLINEYVKDCEILDHGEIKLVPPLEGYETFSIDGVQYEAFYTSGGVGTLCYTLKGKAKYVCYKSIRYPGHREFIQFLLEDLQFKNNTKELVKILENSIPSTGQDVCLIFITCIGKRKGKLEQISLFKKIMNQRILGYEFSAIQIATAASSLACAGQALNEARKGFLKVEDLDVDGVLSHPALKSINV